MAAAATPSIIEWDAKSIGQFGKRPVRMRHNLSGHELFTDRALARTLENLDRDDYYVNTMGAEAHDLSSRREGEIKGLSGEEVLRAVRTGRIWILLLYPHKAEPAYGDLLADIYVDMERALPWFRTSFRKMSLLISSPRVQVHYHCDIPGQTLWQVRGEKRVFVYPSRPPYLMQSNLERIALGEAHELSLPYEPSFDDGAEICDLRAGEMVHWPLNAPHRVVNGDDLCVSFTTEHFTPRDRRNFYVNYANGVLRRRFGFQSLSQSTAGPAYWAKLGVAAAYKFSGRQTKRQKVMRVDFVVDPSAPQGVRTIPAYDVRR